MSMSERLPAAASSGLYPRKTGALAEKVFQGQVGGIFAFECDYRAAGQPGSRGLGQWQDAWPFPWDREKRSACPSHCRSCLAQEKRQVICGECCRRGSVW